MKNLKSTLVLFGLLFALFSSLHAQDIIVKADGTLIKGKVEEITETSIKYRKADNPAGPLYNVNKAEVLTINYENGTIEVVNQEGGDRYNSSPQNRTARNTPRNYRNSFSIGYNRLSFQGSGEKAKANGLAVEYEVKPKGREKMGFRVPFYVWLENGDAILLQSGINPKFYMNDSDLVRLFAGPEILIGYLPPIEVGSAMFLGDVGVSLNVLPEFNMTAYTSLGYSLFFRSGGSGGAFTWNFGFKLGYNF